MGWTLGAFRDRRKNNGVAVPGFILTGAPSAVYHDHRMMVLGTNWSRWRKHFGPAHFRVLHSIATSRSDQHFSKHHFVVAGFIEVSNTSLFFIAAFAIKTPLRFEACEPGCFDNQHAASQFGEFCFN